MSNIPEDIQDMAERIKKHKEKQNSMRKNNVKDSISGIGMAFQISAELISGVLVGAGIGYILDELFDFHNVFLLIFIILGSLAGILNVYRYIKKTEV